MIDFPQQISTLCRQLLLHISASGQSDDSVSSISRLWGSIKEERTPATKPKDIRTSAAGVGLGKVGFIGLGAMGSGMASGERDGLGGDRCCDSIWHRKQCYTKRTLTLQHLTCINPPWMCIPARVGRSPTT